ncbi:MAG: TlpA family protein disulfide reductase [Rhodocyclaceae bacterium]|nr:TlpA family protein disulfide reductase [Rhodocyclaceae bacterium]
MSTWGRRVFVLALLAAAGLAGWFAAGGPPPLPLAGEDTGGGDVTLSVDQFYALSFADSDGNRQRLGQWRDKLLVVNFWATWCPPCRKEIPDFVAVSREYADRGVQFVGLGIDNAYNVSRFADEQQVDYPLLVAGAGSLPIMSALGNPAMALPYTLVVGAGGEIRYTRLGPMDRDALRNTLDRLLSRATGASKPQPG